MIRIVVVDDHPVFRLGMTALLRTMDDIDVVGEADSPESATIIDGTVDVVLMDLHLGSASGIALTRDLTTRYPNLRVLVITMLEDEDSIVAAVRAGARGYVLKGASPAEIERAIRTVANGDLILSARVAARALSTLSRAPSVPAVFPDLTDREREVLDLVARGLDNTSISRRLGLSPKTVRNNVSTVLAKLRLPDRSAAIVHAREYGLGR
ncbi:response regulator transcription factor [Hoyosella sp. YIM 151337]|uniref:response regulator transcription factor n=1 Tax=Hoyosella sp. YIM 151337 TaxID=2992742 RepID=UPI002235C6B2|nr:response regulator transcription factor [Hoyosella sp. YIM 151337]MCW4353961.1 response regulator transcription factor [Hoyosella sp. YIM 151337]